MRRRDLLTLLTVAVVIAVQAPAEEPDVAPDLRGLAEPLKLSLIHI